MELIVNRTDLLGALGNVTPAVAKKTGLPALRSVLLGARDGRLTLSSTDLEIAARAEVPAQVKTEGTTLVPADVLAKATKAMTGESVTLAASDGTLTLSAGTRTNRIRALPAEDFPTLQAVEGPAASVTGQRWRDFADRLCRVACTDEARSILTGILFSLTREGVHGVATDSHRLAWLGVSGSGVAEEITAIVPARACALVGKLASKAEQVAVTLDESQAAWRFDAPHPVTITSRLIEGDFPNWRMLVPDTFPNVVRFDRRAMAEAVKGVSVFAAGGSPVRFALNGSVDLIAGTQDVGECTETVAGASYTGEALIVAFDPALFLDGLLFAASGTLGVRDGNKPALFADQDGGYLLMPIRI